GEVEHAKGELGLGDPVDREAGDLHADLLERDLIGGEAQAVDGGRDDGDAVPRPLEAARALTGAAAPDPAATDVDQVLGRLGGDEAPALHLLRILDGLALAPQVVSEGGGEGGGLGWLCGHRWLLRATKAGAVPAAR